MTRRAAPDRLVPLEALAEGDVTVTIVEGDLIGKTARAQMAFGRRPSYEGLSAFT